STSITWQNGWSTRAIALKPSCATSRIWPAACIPRPRMGWTRCAGISPAYLSGCAARLAKMHSSLTHLNPHSVLERGYSIAETLGGKIVRAAEQVVTGELLRLTFARGAAQTR